MPLTDSAPAPAVAISGLACVLAPGESIASDNGSPSDCCSIIFPIFSIMLDCVCNINTNGARSRGTLSTSRPHSEDTMSDRPVLCSVRRKSRSFVL